MGEFFFLIVVIAIIVATSRKKGKKEESVVLARVRGSDFREINAPAMLPMPSVAAGGTLTVDAAAAYARKFYQQHPRHSFASAARTFSRKVKLHQQVDRGLRRGDLTPTAILGFIDELIQIDSKDALAWCQLAEVYARQGDMDKAEKAASRSATLFRESFRILTTYARILRQNGKNRDAGKILSECRHFASNRSERSLIAQELKRLEHEPDVVIETPIAPDIVIETPVPERKVAFTEEDLAKLEPIPGTEKVIEDPVEPEVIYEKTFEQTTVEEVHEEIEEPDPAIVIPQADVIAPTAEVLMDVVEEPPVVTQIGEIEIMETTHLEELGPKAYQRIDPSTIPSDVPVEISHDLSLLEGLDEEPQSYVAPDADSYTHIGEELVYDTTLDDLSGLEEEAPLDHIELPDMNNSFGGPAVDHLAGLEECLDDPREIWSRYGQACKAGVELRFLESLEQALEGHENPEAWSLLGHLYDDVEESKAIDCFRKAYELDRENLHRGAWLAMNFLENERWDDALAMTEYLENYLGEDPVVHELMAIALDHLNRDLEANDRRDKARQQASRDPRTERQWRLWNAHRAGELHLDPSGALGEPLVAFPEHIGLVQVAAQGSQPGEAENVPMDFGSRVVNTIRFYQGWGTSPDQLHLLGAWRIGLQPMGTATIKVEVSSDGKWKPRLFDAGGEIELEPIRNTA